MDVRWRCFVLALLGSASISCASSDVANRTGGATGATAAGSTTASSGTANAGASGQAATTGTATAGSSGSSGGAGGAGTGSTGQTTVGVGGVGVGGAGTGGAGTGGAGTGGAGAGVGGGAGAGGRGAGGTATGSGGAAGSGGSGGGTSGCVLTAQIPVTTRPINHVPGSEDFTFDKAGNLVGVELQNNALRSTPFTGASQVLVPGAVTGLGRGIRYLLDGDLAVVDKAGTLLRIASNGSKSTILGGMSQPNGIAVGLDGFVYLTMSTGQVRRINANGGAYTVLVNEAARSFDGITFSPDHKTLYVNEESGKVSKMSIDAAGAAGPLQQIADLSGESILDGMTIDECGNLYVVQMSGVVWRVTPAGEKTKVVVLPAGAFICAVNFGSGIGGWKNTALYIMNFSMGVHEVELGFRGKKEVHLPM
jgi:hypothetical protein